MTFTYELLEDAWRKSSKGKHEAPNQAKFEYYLEDNLYWLQDKLTSGTFQPSPLRRKEIYIPKHRTAQVPCLKDKIVQHAICDNYAYEALTRPLIPAISSCIIGKGDDYAINLLKRYMHEFYRKYGTKPYVLKCDVHQYFASVSHERLNGLIERYVLDNDVRLNLSKFIDLTDSGMSLGLQQSQLFGNTYLSEMDHKLKEEHQCRWYARHMDDFLILSNSENELRSLWKWIDHYLNTIGLELNSKTCIEYGKVDYLGFTFIMTDTGKVIMKLKKDKHTTQKHRVRLLTSQIAEGCITPEQAAASYQGWRVHALKGNTRNLVLAMDERFRRYLNGIGYGLFIDKKGVVSIWLKL